MRWMISDNLSFSTLRDASNGLDDAVVERGRQIVTHAGNDEQLGARNVLGGVASAGDGHQWIVGAVNDDRRCLDVTQSFAPIACCRDCRELATET